MASIAREFHRFREAIQEWKAEECKKKKKNRCNASCNLHQVMSQAVLISSEGRRAYEKKWHYTA